MFTPPSFQAMIYIHIFPTSDSWGGGVVNWASTFLEKLKNLGKKVEILNPQNSVFYCFYYFLRHFFNNFENFVIFSKTRARLRA